MRKAYLLYLNARYGNKHWYKYFQKLEEIQWWSSDRIAALQLERLRALLRHAYQNVPYYRKKFTDLGLHPDDIKTLDDLAKLPILTKKDIRENRAELVARNFTQNELIPSATGGSTGEPLQFYASRESSARGIAGEHLAFSWYGYQRGDKRIHLWGSLQHVYLMQSLFKKISLRVSRIVTLDAYNMSENQMDGFARKLCQFKPKIITAFASAVYLLARYLKHRGIESIRPQAVITQAEKLFPHQRRLLEEVFRCGVFDFYGSREVSAMAAECPEHTGYHIMTPNVILEFIRDNQPVSPGEMGKIVVTDLYNYAMPFIRYENGDLGVPSGEKCSCGRGLPMMEEVVGRTSDMMIGIDGKYASGVFFMNILRHKPWVKQFQAKQDKDRNITLSIVPETQPDEGELEAIKALIQQTLGKEIRVDILFVDSIAVTEQGKYRYTISEVPLPF